jgi:hypothetical protein
LILPPPDNLVNRNRLTILAPSGPPAAAAVVAGAALISMFDAARGQCAEPKTERRVYRHAGPAYAWHRRDENVNPRGIMNDDSVKL